MDGWVGGGRQVPKLGTKASRAGGKASASVVLARRDGVHRSGRRADRKSAAARIVQEPYHGDQGE